MKGMKWLGHIALVAAVLFCRLPAHASEEPSEDKTLSPYFFVEKGDQSVDSFPLTSTDVKATVNGVIADVFVTQKYVNNGKTPINARYVFPASTRAAVHGMKMTVGNRVVTARIREREAARQEFERAKSKGKSASLLEEQRPNVFTMSLANIMPGDAVLIELHYTELLTPTDGTYEFVYPTVVGPRYSNRKEATASESDRWVKSPYLKEGKTPPTTFSINVSLSTGIPLQEVSSPSHAIGLSWKNSSMADVSLARTADFAGNRDFILKYRLAGKEIQSGLMLYQGEKENFFLLMVQPPEQVHPADILPREYVFILDVSGSMSGFPLDTAKALIRDLISNLRKSDTFNLVLFAGSSDVMAPSSVPATQENVARALEIIDNQCGGGGTELVPALKNALSIPTSAGTARSVIIISDGYIDAEREVFSLIRKNLDKTNVFSFGIGSSVNRYLIEGIAKSGQGEPFVVTKPEQAAAAASRFRDYVRSPVLTDTRVTFRDFETYGVEPPAIPDLLAKRPLILFGKYRGKPAGSIEVSGRTADGAYRRVFRVRDTKPLPQHAPLRYLWARSRVARLTYFNAQGENPETGKEVTALGLEYSLLTPYTSFIAVLDVVRNPDAKAADVDQPLPLPEGVSNNAVGMSSVPEPGLTALAAAMGTAILFIGLRRRRMGLVRK